ncbi:hypothetical protein PABG_05089 [Paracoccidioides brasiliensis Pb03]|nr:hypothetical protein PABG_05089 [Paracoccidioides brasiliensis Pb03]
MDPVSIVGVIGGAIQITTLITKTVHGLSTLHGKYRNADFTLNSMIVELLTIKAAISQLDELAKYNSNGTPKHPEYIDGLDVAIDGCTAVMDVLSEEVAQLTQAPSDDEEAQPLRLCAKVKVLWNEGLMKEHAQRLHAQVLALQLLLQACYCRTSSEQLKLLRRQENRNIIKRVSDDTATLRSSMSAANSRTDETASSIRGSCTGDTVFEFDQILINEAPYRRAMLKSQRDTRRQVVLPERHDSRSTTMSGTDEGYASGTARTRTPNRTLSSYLSPTIGESIGEDSLGAQPSTSVQREGHISRRQTTSFGRSLSFNNKDNVQRSKSAASTSIQKSSGSTTDKLRSALRRLNTTSRANLSVRASPITGASPTSGSAKQRRNRASESNISINLTSMDSIMPPLIVKAAQSGATLEVENFIKNGADIEARHAETGRNALLVAAHCGKDDIVRLLIYHNANIDVQDSTLSTPLHLAASRGHTGVLRLLLEEVADVDLKNANGMTAFWLSAAYGHTEAARMLLAHGSKINTRTADQMTALHVAAKNGDKEITALLLRYGADIEAKDVNMMAAIHHACEGGHVAVLELLINQKASVEVVGAHQMTPLICSAATGHFLTTEFLLRKKALPRSKDEHGMNAVHWAAFNGHTEIVDLLLQMKAPIGSQNSQGRTPLHLATMNKQFAVVEFLLRKNAPQEVRCRQGFTSLHYACNANRIDFVRLLVASGADIEAQVDGHQHRPIHIAVSLGSLQLTRFLCQKGVFVDSVDSAGIRPLCIACRHGNIEIAEELLRCGALVRMNLADRMFQDSPICIASEVGHASIVSLLLANGSSPVENDEKGWNPFLYAAHYGHPQVLEILFSHHRLTVGTSEFHKFIEMRFAHNVPISQENKKHVENIIQQVRDGRLTLPQIHHYVPHSPYTTIPDIIQNPWQPQDISATPMYAVPVPPFPVRSSSPAELADTTAKDIPHRHPGEQGRTHDSGRTTTYLDDNTIPRLREVGDTEANLTIPIPTPGLTDPENETPSRLETHRCVGAGDDGEIPNCTKAVGSMARNRPEQMQPDVRRELIDSGEDDDGVSDTDSITTVFTALESPGGQLSQRIEIFELEG